MFNNCVTPMYQHMLISQFEISTMQWNNTVKLIGGYQYHGKCDYNNNDDFEIWKISIFEVIIPIIVVLGYISFIL